MPPPAWLQQQPPTSPWRGEASACVGSRYPVASSPPLPHHSTQSLRMLRYTSRPPFRLLSGDRLGTQPHRDVRGSHRLPDHLKQFGVQGVEISLISELQRERFQRLPRIVFSAVEAPVHERLHTVPQGVEQRRYGQRGGDGGKSIVFSHDRREKPLQPHHAAEVHNRQHYCKRTVDQGSVDDDVYVVEAVLDD